jgi:hypothetical protein
MAEGTQCVHLHNISKGKYEQAQVTHHICGLVLQSQGHGEFLRYLESGRFVDPGMVLSMASIQCQHPPIATKLDGTYNTIPEKFKKALSAE